MYSSSSLPLPSLSHTTATSSSSSSVSMKSSLEIGRDSEEIRNSSVSSSSSTSSSFVRPTLCSVIQRVYVGVFRADVDTITSLLSIPSPSSSSSSSSFSSYPFYLSHEEVNKVEEIAASLLLEETEEDQVEEILNNRLSLLSGERSLRLEEVSELILKECKELFVISAELFMECQVRRGDALTLLDMAIYLDNLEIVRLLFDLWLSLLMRKEGGKEFEPEAKETLTKSLLQNPNSPLTLAGILGRSSVVQFIMELVVSSISLASSSSSSSPSSSFTSIPSLSSFSPSTFRLPREFVRAVFSTARAGSVECVKLFLDSKFIIEKQKRNEKLVVNLSSVGVSTGGSGVERERETVSLETLVLIGGIEGGHLEMVQEALMRGAAVVGVPSFAGKKLVALAVNAGSLPILQEIISKGAQVDEGSLFFFFSSSSSPYSLAIQKGRLDILKYLIETNHNNRSKNHGSCSSSSSSSSSSFGPPKHVWGSACAMGGISEFRVLVEWGYTPPKELEFLSIAARTGNVELLKELIETHHFHLPSPFSLSSSLSSPTSPRTTSSTTNGGLLSVGGMVEGGGNTFPPSSPPSFSSFIIPKVSDHPLSAACAGSTDSHTEALRYLLSKTSFSVPILTDALTTACAKCHPAQAIILLDALRARGKLEPGGGGESQMQTTEGGVDIISILLSLFERYYQPSYQEDALTIVHNILENDHHYIFVHPPSPSSSIQLLQRACEVEILPPNSQHYNTNNSGNNHELRLLRMLLDTFALASSDIIEEFSNVMNDKLRELESVSCCSPLAVLLHHYLLTSTSVSSPLSSVYYCNPEQERERIESVISLLLDRRALRYPNISSPSPSPSSSAFSTSRLLVPLRLQVQVLQYLNLHRDSFPTSSELAVFFPIELLERIRPKEGLLPLSSYLSPEFREQHLHNNE